jgi:hypothetical protein
MSHVQALSTLPEPRSHPKAFYSSSLLGSRCRSREVYTVIKVSRAVAGTPSTWMSQGTQEEIMTPGTNEKHYLAGALHLATGKVLYCLGPRKNNVLFRDLLAILDRTYPAPGITRIYVVVDNYCIHKAKAVDQ